MPTRIVNVAGDDLETKPLIKERRLEAVSVQHHLIASAHDRLALRNFHESFAIATIAEVFANPQVADFTGSAPGPSIEAGDDVSTLVAEKKRHDSSVANLRGLNVVLVDM